MKIRINNIDYTEHTLHVLLEDTMPTEHWQRSVYHFLKSWCDSESFIEVMTSGSTGQPKTIRLLKKTMEHSARMTNSYFRLTPDKTALLCLPASYIAGKMMLVRAIVGGFSLVAVAPAANPFEGLQQRINFAAITPYQLSHSITSLRSADVGSVIVGGSPVSQQLEDQTQELSTRFYETYGMTETASHIALRPFNGSGRSSTFEVLEGVTIGLDERGCLTIDAPYLHNEKLITNDLVALEDARRFRWQGRADRVINSGGVKLFPEQIERKLSGLIDLPFFVAGMPDAELGERAVLLIESAHIAKSELTRLRGLMESRLQRYELPKQIFVLPGFVYSSGDKVLRPDTLALLSAES